MIGNSGFRIHASDILEDRSKQLDEGLQLVSQRSRSGDLGLSDPGNKESQIGKKPSMMNTVDNLQDLSTGFATSLNFDMDFQKGSSTASRRGPIIRSTADDLNNIWSDSVDRLNVNRPLSTLSQG